MNERRICIICGQEFSPTNYNATCCSPECRKERHKYTSYIYHKEHKFQKMTPKQIAKEQKRLERIAHQQDTSVWTHDYAQRQMQKTLAMIGGVGSDM